MRMNIWAIYRFLGSAVYAGVVIGVTCGASAQGLFVDSYFKGTVI